MTSPTSRSRPRPSPLWTSPARQRTETITQAVPIAGSLSLTMPKTASGIDAPGATLTPGPSGVGASWTILVAPPLAPAHQTISYSMNVARAAIPRAKLVLGVIAPAQGGTGQAPAAVGAAAGAAVATAKVAAQAQLAQAQAEAQASLEQVHAALTGLEQAQSDAQARVGGASDARLDALANRSDGGLSNLSDTISMTATHVSAEINAAAAPIRNALDGLRTEISDHVDRLTAHAGELDLMKTAIDALAATTSGLAAQAAQHATDATDLRTMIAGAVSDLNLFSDHTAPEWLRLAGDLATAQAKADVVVSAATDVATAAAQADAAVQRLRDKLAALIDGFRDLVGAGDRIRDPCDDRHRGRQK